MENKAKKCASCGLTLTLDHFRKTPFSSDGYSKMCKQCIRAQRVQGRRGSGNPELAGYPARVLIDELRARGYAGTLKITQEIKV